MAVQTLHDKFVYHLEEMYYVENQLLEVLRDIETEVTNDDLQAALVRHREQTESHVRRLEEVFEDIGVQAQERPSPTFDALLEERKEFLAQANEDDDMRDLHNLGIVAKNEHMEIAGYENLIMLARKLDLSSDIRENLDDNLDDEKSAKKQLKALADDSTLRKIFGRLTG